MSHTTDPTADPAGRVFASAITGAAARVRRPLHGRLIGERSRELRSTPKTYAAP
jgi:hypothetical protein